MITGPGIAALGYLFVCPRHGPRVTTGSNAPPPPLNTDPGRVAPGLVRIESASSSDLDSSEEEEGETVKGPTGKTATVLTGCGSPPPLPSADIGVLLGRARVIT